jgi:cobalt-zinc-cadmium efflux system membrane fusion protein
MSTPVKPSRDGAALYTIADLSEVWVDLNVPKRDQARVKVGQTATIHADDGGTDAYGHRSRGFRRSVPPRRRRSIARVVLANTDQRWRPGLFVKAASPSPKSAVPVAVKESAIADALRLHRGVLAARRLYQARPLELGRRGGGYVEVLKGLKAGERYVTENSFLIKADIGKSGASHDH